MNDTERRLARHLRREAERAPDVDLVAAARTAAPARRSWTTPALVTAAVVVLVAVGALVVPRGGDDEPVAAPTTSPAVAAGQRLVGRDDVVVAVPSSWPVEGFTCERLERSTVVVVPEPMPLCGPGEPLGDVVVVTLGISALDPAPETIRTLDDGTTVEVSQRRRAGSRVSTTVRSTSSGAALTLSGPPDEVRALVDTVRPVPDGSVVVPVVTGDLGPRDDYLREVSRQYEAAGLRVESFRRASGPRDARESSRRSALIEVGALQDLGDGLTADVRSGTVVPRGTTVVISGD